VDLFGVDIQLLETFLSGAAKSSLAEKLIVVSVIWIAIRSKVKRHFEKMEESVSAIPKIAESVKELKDAIVALEIKQTERINQISNRW